MSLTAPILEQAREALLEAANQKLTLLGAVKEQGRKIAELEREVQKQETGRMQAEQALADAKIEIESLRSQIPDSRFINAYEALTQFLTAPSEVHPDLRIAAYAGREPVACREKSQRAEAFVGRLRPHLFLRTRAWLGGRIVAHRSGCAGDQIVISAMRCAGA
ncbi:MAG TPA: hypothetical protein VER17_04210 [Tepidisphaeraceae bacterium]|nr:hypothetical protein [Tepidisphaeraceae bacterium]